MSHATGPPPEDVIRARDAAPRTTEGRDTTPAVGHRGEPGGWRRAFEGARVSLHQTEWRDGRWSYLYGRRTIYRREVTDVEKIRDAARRARGGPDITVAVQGPIMNPAVWTWEVPLYFFLGGIATGSSFVGMACDLAGDHRSAAVARKVTLAAIGPGAPLLVLDLGRPLRFLNMLRIFKPRSPMNLGAWCLSAFSASVAASIAADLLGRPRLARALGVNTAVLGTYLGSYTGVLLASTAVPVWARSRLFLPPIFICTGAATGAAVNRLVLAATGTPPGHPSRSALGTVETAAMGAELVLSYVNERRLGSLRPALEEGRPGQLFRFARGAVVAGLGLRFARERGGPAVHHLASLLYLAAGLAFRFAWVGAGRTSALDHESVALMARRKARPAGREQL